MRSVKIIGAGSIGNHLSHGCRSKGWDVTLVDVDRDALARSRDTIYPSRYGTWDSGITLATPDEAAGQRFDIVIVGTPPATHLAVATAELLSAAPRLLLIEKPLSHPDFATISAFIDLARKSPTRVLVGYNQRTKPNTQKFLEVARDSALGALTGLESDMLESWDGILKAHFWMASEKDSYLAFTNQGGGALLEHSHALNLFLHFATELGQGPVRTVKAVMDWVEHDSGAYDRETELQLTLESGLIGKVRQDLHTWPAKKQAKAVFEDGEVSWIMGETRDVVSVRRAGGGAFESWEFPKSRPDDFLGEISHLSEVLEDPKQASPLDLKAGLSVMEIALAAIKSSQSGLAETVAKLGPSI